ncbi:hypothetical protein ACWFPY_04665 [Nocardia fluminea]
MHQAPAAGSRSRPPPSTRRRLRPRARRAGPRALLNLITPLRGRILSYGWLDGAPAQLGATELILRGLTLTGCAGTAWLDEVARQRSAALTATAQGLLTPVIDSVLPLADAVKGHQMLEDRVAFGTVRP